MSVRDLAKEQSAAQTNATATPPSVPANDDWAAAAEPVGPVPSSALADATTKVARVLAPAGAPPSTEAPATTKVPRLAQNMAGVLDAIARDGDTAHDAIDEQRTERHMMAMPPPTTPPTSAEPTVVRVVKPSDAELDPVRPRMLGGPLPHPADAEVRLAETAGLGGVTFGVRAIVQRATVAEQTAANAANAALEGKGVTALDLLRAVGVLPAALAAKLMSDVARALAELHAQGFVHREMRPSTVRISASGLVTLADEGRTAASSTDEHVTDVFSLGRLFHHLLAGRDPFADGDARPADLMEVAPTLPELLPLVVDKLMKRERGERVQSATAAHALLAPLAQIIEVRHPRLLAEAVVDPSGVVKKLRAEQAFAEYLRASACMKQRPPRKREAAYALRRSIELDSMELRGQKLLRKLCASEGFTFVIPDDPALVDAKSGDDALKLRAMGEKCAANGAIEQAALCFRRARARGDEASQLALSEIVGDDARQPFPFLPEVPVASDAVTTAAVTNEAPVLQAPLKVRVVLDTHAAVPPRRDLRVVAAIASLVVIVAVLVALRLL